MKKNVFTVSLIMVVSTMFCQLRVDTNGSFGTTTNVPLIFSVNNVKYWTIGNSSNANVSFGYEAYDFNEITMIMKCFFYD